jgi:hypothetical protein
MPSYIASKQHIKLARKGDYFEREFIFNTLNLTGKSAKCQVRNEAGSTVLFEFSTANSRIVISGTSLKLICPANEFTLDPNTYVFDIQVYTSVADISTLIEGTFEVIDEITV